MSKEDKEVMESIKIMLKDIMDVDKTTLEGFNAFMNIKKNVSDALTSDALTSDAYIYISKIKGIQHLKTNQDQFKTIVILYLCLRGILQDQFNLNYNEAEIILSLIDDTMKSFEIDSIVI